MMTKKFEHMPRRKNHLVVSVLLLVVTAALLGTAILLVRTKLLQNTQNLGSALARSYALEEELLRWKRGENIRERYVGSLIVTGSFALYFGGTVADGLAAVAFAPLVCFLQVRFERFFPNKVTFYVFCSFLTGILICLGSRLTGWFHYDRVILGDMMLLIPGLALMNSVRDALAGNTISGIMRLTESLIWTGALVIGFMGAIWLAA